mmetsp:Transcript_29304/g.44141  ORF Transcript_29304/g.44141 Transcript_29304/m.44141 type:complete len:140 (+) Transcript_29304:1303-1722(+)
MPTEGLSNAELGQIDREANDARTYHLKNRHFDLNVTANAYHEVLFKYQNAEYAIFMDMIENSMLDLIVVSKSPFSHPVTREHIPQISAIYNNLFGDTFYIKSRMLSDDKIGSPIRATSFRAVLTSLDDEKFIVQGGDSC